MIAITVTQELKDTNVRLFFNDAVGSIKLLNSIPTSIYSLSYKIGKRTDGYHTLSSSIHESDGFYDVVKPVSGVDYDSAIERLGSIVWDAVNSYFTYPIEALSAQELADKAQRLEDEDSASQFFGERKRKGLQYIERFNAFVYRKVVNAEITKPQAITTLSFFYEALTPLTFGYLEEARNRVTALTTGNAQLNTIKNKIINDIQAFIDNE